MYTLSEVKVLVRQIMRRYRCELHYAITLLKSSQVHAFLEGGN